MATLSNTDIARAIYETSKGKKGEGLTLELRKVVQFLYRKNLLSNKLDIIEKLRKIINTEEGIVTAKVLSVKGIEEGFRKDLINFLKERYRANVVEVEEESDDKILGGVRVEINNEVIDMTLKNQITQLQKHLTGNA